MDEKNERSNFVLMQCEQNQVVVFVAHLKQGSVQVAAGDRVSTGQQLGEIGNSGSSGGLISAPTRSVLEAIQLR